MSEYGIFGNRQEYYAYLSEITKRYSETARGFVQLATAALVLPIVFARQILGVPEKESVSGHLTLTMYLSWMAFGLTIVTGIAYQYWSVRLADRYGEGLSTKPESTAAPLFYASMAITFCAGVLLFCVGVAQAKR